MYHDDRKRTGGTAFQRGLRVVVDLLRDAVQPKTPDAGLRRRLFHAGQVFVPVCTGLAAIAVSRADVCDVGYVHEPNRLVRRQVERVAVQRQAAAAPYVERRPRAPEPAPGEHDVSVAVGRRFHLLVHAEEHAAVDERAALDADVPRRAAFQPSVAGPREDRLSFEAVEDAVLHHAVRRVADEPARPVRAEPAPAQQKAVAALVLRHEERPRLERVAFAVERHLHHRVARLDHLLHESLLHVRDLRRRRFGRTQGGDDRLHRRDMPVLGDDLDWIAHLQRPGVHVLDEHARDAPLRRRDVLVGPVDVHVVVAMVPRHAADQRRTPLHGPAVERVVVTASVARQRARHWIAPRVPRHHGATRVGVAAEPQDLTEGVGTGRGVDGHVFDAAVRAAHQVDGMRPGAD